MCTHSAQSLISPLNQALLGALEAEQGSAYLLGLDLSIQYVNEGWRRFARENSAPELATGWDTRQPITRFFEPPLSEFFAVRFQRVLERNEAWSQSYECSSRDVFRKFKMRVEPTAQRDGLIVVHSLLVESALRPEGETVDDRARTFTDSRGLIVVCSVCGRVRNTLASSWDWAPGLASTDGLNVSHGICSTCDFQYYCQDGAPKT